MAGRHTRATAGAAEAQADSVSAAKGHTVKKVSIKERANWQQKVESGGFFFHNVEGARYWDERGYYQFTEAQITQDIERPTQELHEMSMDLVARVVDSEALLSRLAIPPQFHDLVWRSWKDRHPYLYSRFDFIYDGKGPAKLIESNADTPTSLLEAASVQLLWLEDLLQQEQLPVNATQYNTLAHDLTRVFASLNKDTPFYFSSISASLEDRGTTDFLRKMAGNAGIDARHIDLEHIGLTQAGRFVDLDGNWIQRLFKLHPWEHIFHEPYGSSIPDADTRFIEPAWKAILSNKGMLPLLWEFNKGHPNLLPTFFDSTPDKPLPKGWVRKPFFSREGANIELRTTNGERVFQEGPYTEGPFVLQKFEPLPKFGDSFTLIGSWVIGDVPSGMGIREDDTLITKNTSRFIPHIVLD